MAQPNSSVLTDDAVPGAVLEIIRDANEYVVLVSPYIDLWWVHLKTAIQDARQREIRFTLICRPIDKNTRDPHRMRGDLAWLRGQGTTVHTVPNLHAKFYLNEASALLTSMNLSGYSSRSSLEVGVRLESKEEVRALQEYAKRLTKQGIAKDDAPPQTDAPGDASWPYTPRERTAREPQLQYRIDKDMPGRVLDKVRGRLQRTHCIRCQGLTPYNLEKPLCRDCFPIWDEYKNPNYTERFCHKCGHPAPTTLAKPLCRACSAAA